MLEIPKNKTEEEQIISSAETMENRERLTEEKSESKLLISQLEEAFSEGNSEVFNQVINKLEELIEKLKQEAIYDYLTELYNTRGFEKIMNDHISAIKNKQEYPERRKDKYPHSIFTIINCDLNAFKLINDLYGHAVGNMILKEVAGVLRSSIRAFDIAARLGGDEFVIVLLGANEEGAIKKIEEIRQKIEQIAGKYLHQYPKIKISASFGIQEYKDGLDLETLMDLADKKMYEEKENKKIK